MTGTTASEKGAGKPASAVLTSFKAELLPDARSYVAKLPKADQAADLPMSDDQMIVLYIAGWYRERWDDLFKADYLPYPGSSIVPRSSDRDALGQTMRSSPSPLQWPPAERLAVSRARVQSTAGSRC